MDKRSHNIWIEQCHAAETIKRRYGIESAFDYLVTQKLPTFAEAAERHAAFARALPRFITRVRQTFTPQEILTHLARIECERRKAERLPGEDEDPRRWFQVEVRDEQRFAALRVFLTAPELGMS